MVIRFCIVHEDRPPGCIYKIATTPVDKIIHSLNKNTKDGVKLRRGGEGHGILMRLHENTVDA